MRLGSLGDAAARTAVLSANLHGLQVEMVVASAASLLALLVVTGLGVYKPRGVTPYGWRKQNEKRTVSAVDTMTPVQPTR